MTDDELGRRKGLTFAQAEGKASLPTQLHKEQISPQLRSSMWAYIHSDIQEGQSGLGMPVVIDPWRSALWEFHVKYLHQPADEFNRRADHQYGLLKRHLFDGDWIDFYSVIQFFLRARSLSGRLASAVDAILNNTLSPYRVIDGDTLCPIGTDEERQTIELAFAGLSSASHAGGRTHLKAAVEACSAGEFAASVRESISAVESVVFKISGKQKLSDGLAEIQKSINIHGGLKAAFSQLYGYTSDAQGVRHALVLQDKANVDEADALFMLGACAAFLSYLLSRSR